MCTRIQLFLWTPEFSLRGKFIPVPKIPILAILGAVGPRFKTHNGEIWHEGANLGLPPEAKFCKNRLRGKFIPQISNFGGCKPTF